VSDEIGATALGSLIGMLTGLKGEALSYVIWIIVLPLLYFAVLLFFIFASILRPVKVTGITEEAVYLKIKDQAFLSEFKTLNREIISQ
jgi:hypothetical protein